MTAVQVEPTTESGGNGRAAGVVFGVALAILGIVALMVPAAGFSVADDIPIETMLAKLADAAPTLMFGGGLQALVAMGLVIYGALIRRALTSREGPGPLTPTIAWGGALLAAATAAAAAAHTQLMGGMEEQVADPAVLLTLHTLEENLFAGAWCAIALVSGSVAVAGLRRGSVPRWLGGVSAFVTVLLLVAQVVVPWAAWFPALVWVAVSALALRNT